MPEGMQTAISTAMTAVKSDVFSVMSDALPIGLAIMGVSLAVTIGVTFFKRVSRQS